MIELESIPKNMVKGCKAVYRGLFDVPANKHIRFYGKYRSIRCKPYFLSIGGRSVGYVVLHKHPKRKGALQVSVSLVLFKKCRNKGLMTEYFIPLLRYIAERFNCHPTFVTKVPVLLRIIEENENLFYKFEENPDGSKTFLFLRFRG